MRKALKRQFDETLLEVDSLHYMSSNELKICLLCMIEGTSSTAKARTLASIRDAIGIIKRARLRASGGKEGDAYGRNEALVAAQQK